ncbi:MAG: hypothetical protein LBC45_02825 [Chlamydiales bacterium]|jgi:hypothetical protein|nr:hypothetical protein [Chlamydiales bacterium]
MTVANNVDNLTNLFTTNHLLDVQKNLPHLEESIDKEISDTALGVLRQLSMKMQLFQKNQDQLLIEIQKLHIKLEQVERKFTIPSPPPLPLALSSHFPSTANKKLSITKQESIRSDSPNQDLLIPTKTQIQEKLETLRKSKKNEEKICLTLQKDTALALKTETGNLGQTQPLYAKKEENKTPEAEKTMSFAEKVNHLETCFKSRIK